MTYNSKCYSLAVCHAGDVLPLVKDVLKLEDIDPHEDNHGVQDNDPPEQPHTDSPDSVTQLHTRQDMRHFHQPAEHLFFTSPCWPSQVPVLRIVSGNGPMCFNSLCFRKKKIASAQMQAMHNTTFDLTYRYSSLATVAYSPCKAMYSVAYTVHNQIF